MNVGLFDLHTGGHHLPYAHRIKRELEANHEHDVTFLTLCETDSCAELFDRDEVRYLDNPESPRLEDREGSFDAITDALLEDFFTGELTELFDVVHFLYADTILGPLWRHCTSSDETSFIGELNGTFFHRGTVLRRRRLHRLFLRLLRSSIGPLVDSTVPNRTSHEALWSDLYLYRCLRHETFDRVIVHSEEAEQYASRLAPQLRNGTQRIPYPAPAEFGNDIPRTEARRRLDLPVGVPILLFFGSMRSEKGITFLLESLLRYSGPEFTLALAGPPVAVNEGEIRRYAEQSPVDIVHELGFIDRPEVYYRAADAVVLPYRRQYGKERASQMFQEVCSSLRPVIVPDEGVLGRLTEEWDLGATYEQGSSESLVETLATFADDGIPFSERRMQEYVHQHSYEQIARELDELYANSHSSSE